MTCSHLSKLPAIRWKLHNLAKLKKANPRKFEQQAHELREKFRSEMAQAESGAASQSALCATGSDETDGAADLRQFHAAVELFYPGSRRGASGPVERAFEPAEEEGELLEVS